MENAGQILKGLIENLPAARDMIEGNRLLEMWNEVADRNDLSWPVKFSSGILFVASEDPSFAQELRMKRMQFVEEFNRRARKNLVKDVKITVCGRSKRPQGEKDG